MPLVLVKSDPKAREKPCLRCGYSLRKLLDSRNCPECGLSVWVSLNTNDSLDWSRPEWLRMISFGALLMAAAQCLGLLAAIVLIYPIWGPWISSWIIGLYLISLGAGMVILSLPERRYPDRLKPHRIFLLIAASLHLLLGLSISAYAAADRSALGPYSFFLPFFIEIILLIGALATLLYLRKLAHRLGRHRLSKIMGWLLLIPLLKFIQYSPFLGLYLASQFFGLSTLLPWLYIPISLGILIYLALGFRHAAKEAEVNWARAG